MNWEANWEAGVRQLSAMPAFELIPLIAIPIYYISFLGVYAVRRAMWGAYEPDRIKQYETRVLTRFLLEYGYWMVNYQVKLFLLLRISANQITFLSLVLTGGGAIYIGQGRFALGGWLIFFGFFCDAYDGIVARATGTNWEGGAVLDAVVDRYADLFTGLGFLYYYRNDPIPSALVAAMIVGSQVMGYARAKGASVGFDPNVGFMQRGERAVYLSIPTVLSPIIGAFIEPGAERPMHYVVLVAIAIVALFTNITGIWRTKYVLDALRARDREKAEAATDES